MPKAIPESVRDAILTDIRSGTKSRAKIAKEHGVSAQTVTNIAKRAGIDEPFSRLQTKKATAAKLADQAARRAALADRYLQLIDLAITQVATELADASAYQAATIIGILTDKHIALVRHDADPGVEAAKSMLADLFAGLGEAYQQLTRAEQNDAG